MAQHPHPQLTAHSQLTHLTTGQFQYIQIPASLLSNTNNHYHQPMSESRVPGTSHFVLPSVSTSFPEPPSILEECLICFVPVTTRIVASGRRPRDIFEKICELFQVPMHEILYEWDFENGDNLSLCQECMNAIQTLLLLQDELDAIQKNIWNGMEDIRAKIRDSNARLSSFDLRTINFRNKLLAPDTPSATSSFQHLENMPSSNSNMIPDLNNMLNPPLNGIMTSIEIQDELLALPQQQQYVQQLTSPTDEIGTFSTLEQMSIPPATCISQTQPNNIPLPNDFFNSTNPVHATTALIIEDTNIINETSVAQDLQKTNNSSCMTNEDIWHVQEPTHVDVMNLHNPSEISAVKMSRRRKSKPNLKSTFDVMNKYQYFSPIQMDEDGKMLFEGIAVIPAETGYACGKCSAFYGKRRDAAALRKIKVHIKGVHLGAYKCELCNKTFSSNDILAQHRTRQHLEKNVPCDICGRPMKARSIPKHKFSHMSIEEKEDMIANGFTFPIESMDKMFTCPTCGKSFGRKSILTRHEASHVDLESRKKFKCDLCSNSYFSAGSLQRHKVLSHESSNNKRKSTCSHCGKVVPVGYLQKHIKRHLDKRLLGVFTCKICKAPLQNAKALKRHEILHGSTDTPEMFKFECGLCGKRFVTRQKLRSHLKSSHGSTDAACKVPAHDYAMEVDKSDPDIDKEIEQVQSLDGEHFSYKLFRILKMKSPKTRYRCCACSKEFEGENVETSLQEIKHHIDNEHVGNFRCNICNIRSKNLCECVANKQMDHMNCCRRCVICGKPGLHRRMAQLHEWSHRSLSDMADAINTGETLPTEFMMRIRNYEATLRDLDVQVDFQCALCSSRFETVKLLYEHAKDHRDDLKSEGNQSERYTIDKKSYTENIKQHRKTLAAKNGLRKHEPQERWRNISKKTQKVESKSGNRRNLADDIVNHIKQRPASCREPETGPKIKKNKATNSTRNSAGQMRRYCGENERGRRSNEGFASGNIRLPHGLETGYTIEYIYPSDEDDKACNQSKCD